VASSLPRSVLVVGSGGREHALVKACLASPARPRVIAAPGNGGIAQEAACFPVPAEDLAGVVALAQREKIEFVIVGPEVPLSLGLVDALAAAGFSAYGPQGAAEGVGAQVFERCSGVSGRGGTGEKVGFKQL
jgi:phosphoribosylamine--glycine ligase